MPTLEVKHLSKRFDEALAVNEISFDVDKGQIVTLLGPSGCGKTTTLRLIAGFESPDDGDILIQGKSVINRRPYERHVGLLFQDYALFPHLTVEQNIAFGMRHLGVDRRDIAKGVAEMLSLVKLEGYDKRRPAELSGGQQQRVALARALAVRPEIMLLDEPLSALDAKLRQELRVELKEILTKMAMATVVVTHDQTEAMSLSDKVVVISEGRIAQEGDPMEIYTRPQSRFVAEFVGSSNWFRGELLAESLPGMRIFRIAGGPPIHVPEPAEPLEHKIYQVCVRPERMKLAHPNATVDADSNTNLLHGTIQNVSLLGAELSILIELSFGMQIEATEKNWGQIARRPGEDVCVQFQSIDCIVLHDHC